MKRKVLFTCLVFVILFPMIIANASIQSNIVDEARKWLGSPYILNANGTNYGDAVDCSRLTQQVYHHFGYEIQRTAATQYSTNGTRVSNGNLSGSWDALQEGDLLFWNTLDNNKLVDHVGIYSGNRQMIHASYSAGKVVEVSIDNSYWKSVFVGANRIISDTNLPSIESLTVTDVSNNSFKINCTVNKVISRAYIIVYGPGGNSGTGFDIYDINNTSFSRMINTSDYGGTGEYVVHVYVFDAAGNSAPASTGTFTTKGMKVNSFTVENKSPASFTVKCVANSTISRAYIIVYGPGGNSGTGFDIYDINSKSFSRTINTSDYGGTGEYIVHVYVFDAAGSRASASTEKFTIEEIKVNGFTVENKSPASFTVKCVANSTISRAYIIVYGPGGNSGTGFDVYDINSTSFTRNISTGDYGGIGEYTVHVYIFDTAGNSASASTEKFIIPNLSVEEYTVSNITDSSFVLNGRANYPISHAYIIVYGPGGNSGTGFDIYDINSTSFRKKIDISEYGGRGSYIAHLYVFDAAGNSASAATKKFYVPQSLAPLSMSSQIDKNDNSVNVRTKISNLQEDAVCLCAAYDKNDNLLDKSIFKVGAGESNVNSTYNDKEVSCVKVFLWDSLERMKPLTNPETSNLP